MQITEIKSSYEVLLPRVSFETLVDVFMLSLTAGIALSLGVLIVAGCFAALKSDKKDNKKEEKKEG